MLRIALPVLLSLLALGAGGTTEQPQNATTGTAVQSGNRLGFKLLSQLARTGDRNVFISPTSIAMCLTMAYNGAKGTTLGAFTEALGYQDMDPGTINDANAALRSELVGADPKVRLDIANSLWANKTVALQERFVNICQQSFKARLTALDFKSPQAVPTINSWVSENTNGRIQKIVSSLSRNDLLLLVNAIYFKGTWTRQFDAKQTAARKFYLTPEKTVQRQMMRREDDFSYQASDEFQAVSLPYGNGRLCMYVFLPSSRDGLPTLMARMTQANWDEWMGGFKKQKGEVVLPRFRIEYDTSLVEPLRGLGLDVAFNAKEADFSYMVKPPTQAFIGDVVHKTFVEVNEEGTEAAAVTGVKMMTTSMPPKTEKFSFIADHPFVCAIRDNVTGAILFIGTIADPKQ